MNASVRAALRSVLRVRRGLVADGHPPDAVEVADAELERIVRRRLSLEAIGVLERRLLDAPDPPARRRRRSWKRIDAAIVQVLKERTGFRGPDEVGGVTTDALVSELRSRGFRTSPETVRRRTIRLAESGAVAAEKRVFSVPQRRKKGSEWGPDLFGGVGRCVRRQWRWFAPGQDHPPGVRG